MTDSLQALTDLRNQIEQARAQMRENAKALLKDGTKAIFDEYGDIVGMFGWTQYTPYFNDGEPCEFGVHDLAIYSVREMEEADGDDPDEWPYESGEDFGSTWSDRHPAKDERHQEARQKIKIIYDALASAEDISRDVLGDHVVVRFTKDGVEVDEYSHD